MHKKRWLAAVLFIATVLSNFSAIGFGLAVFQRDYDCAFISMITLIAGFLLTLGGSSDGSKVVRFFSHDGVCRLGLLLLEEGLRGQRVAIKNFLLCPTVDYRGSAQADPLTISVSRRLTFRR